MHACEFVCVCGYACMHPSLCVCVCVCVCVLHKCTFIIHFVFMYMQDVTEEMCYKYPRLYIAGQQNKRFNRITFLLSLFKGIVAALSIFFVLFGFTYLNVMSQGFDWDYQSVGYAASGALVVIVNLQVNALCCCS